MYQIIYYKIPPRKNNPIKYIDIHDRNKRISRQTKLTTEQLSNNKTTPVTRTNKFNTAQDAA